MITFLEYTEEEASKWHFKPVNVRGPCPICGCPAKNLKAKHRLVLSGGNPTWEKIFKVSFGGDTSIETYGTPGWPA